MSGWTDPRPSFNAATLEATGSVNGDAIDLLGVKSDHVIQVTVAVGAGVEATIVSSGGPATVTAYLSSR
jgi:hypothetical protein